MAKEIAKAAEASSAIVSAADAKAAHKLADAKATVALKLQVAEQAHAMKLEEQAQIIRTEHAKVVELGQSAFMAGIAIGHALIKAKALFGKHGSWLKWKANNLPFSDRTADVYVSLAENEKFLMKKHDDARAQNASGLSLNTALKELRGPTRKNNKSSKKTTKPTANAAEAATVEPVGTVQWFVELSATLRQIVQNPTPLSSTIDPANRARITVALRELQWSAATITGAVAPLIDADPEAKPHQYPDWLEMVERQLFDLISNNTFAQLRAAAAMQTGSADSTLKNIRSIKDQLKGLEEIISAREDIQQANVVATTLEGGAAAAAAHA